MTQWRWYTFNGGGDTVVVQRGEEPPTITDGYGGWEVLERPRRTGYVQWKGISPYRMKLACLIDGWREEKGVERVIERLSAMALPVEGGEPPIVDVIGATPLPEVRRWVIESLEWGTNVIWSEHTGDHPAYRRRQDVVVNLLQHVEAESLPRGKNVGGGRPPRKIKTWKWRKGDTLRKVSVKAYGNQKYWSVIAKANQIRDPKKIKIGRVLKIPK